MLSNFQHQTWTSALHFQSIENGWQVVIELNIHHSTNDSHNSAVGGLWTSLGSIVCGNQFRESGQLGINTKGETLQWRNLVVAFFSFFGLQLQFLWCTIDPFFTTLLLGYCLFSQILYYLIFFSQFSIILEGQFRIPQLFQVSRIVYLQVNPVRYLPFINKFK